MRCSIAKASCIAVCLTICAALTGCAVGAPTGPDEPRQELAASINEQLTIITGRDEFELEPIDGAEAWLQDDDIEAFVDTLTYDEFIIDTTREMVLSYDPGTHIYQEPIDLPPYPGEPSREEILGLADDYARENVSDRDISSMRRTAWRRVSGGDTMGDELQYQVLYRRYVNGVKVPEYASVMVSLPSWTWEPSFNAYERAGSSEAPPDPGVTMLDALETAVGESGFAEYRVKELSLSYWNGEYFWAFELENSNAPEDSFGGHGAWVRIDAMSGDCLEVATSG